MNSEQWDEAHDPNEMLKFLDYFAHLRKHQLFACACIERVREFVRHEELKSCLDIIRFYPDSPVSLDTIQLAQTKSDKILEEFKFGPDHPKDFIEYYPGAAIYRFFRWIHDEGMPVGVGSCCRTAMGRVSWINAIQMDEPNKYQTAQQIKDTIEQNEALQQCNLLREIFGNPFHPVTTDPIWLTPTVTAMAQAMYEDRNFTAMPILGDALEEAGCDNEDILQHCRDMTGHVRGCWLVDLVLDKQ